VATEVRIEELGISWDRELRRVSVLFFDIARFSSISGMIGPEGTADFLDFVMRRVAEEVYSREGWVGSYLGDGFMAAFGVPMAHSDDAARAVDAAIGIKGVCSYIREEVEKTFGTPFSARVGVNEGEVLAGYLGGGMKREYTIVGETVNVARRLQEGCPEGEILVSESIYTKTKDLFSYSFFGDLSLKGISRPIKAYMAEGRKGRPSRIPKPRLIGREKEISTIMEILLGNGGGAVLIWGEAGIGKTRLLDEVEERLISRGVLTARSKCSGTAEPSMAPFREIVRNIAGAQMEEPMASVREKVRRLLERIGWEEDGSPLIPLMEIVSGYREGLSDRDGLEIDTLAYGIASFLEGLGRRGRVVLMIDDVHAMDKISQKICAALVDSRPDSLSLLLSSREPLEWIGDDVVLMEIHPLSREESEGLLREVIGDRAFPEAVRDSLLERASGNPFLIEGYAMALAENPDMHPMYLVPDPVWRVVMSTVDALPKDAKRLARISSVLGQRFPMRLLEALPLDFPCEGALVSLAKAGILVEDMVFPERGWAFKNPIIQEVLYSSIPRRERLRLHGFVAKALEEVFRDRIEEMYETIADHWEMAGKIERAFSYIQGAMDRFLSMPIDDALRICRKGVDLLDRIGDRGLRMGQALRKLSKALELMGDLTSAREPLRRALGLELDPEERAMAMADMARLAEGKEEAESFLHSAEELLRAMGLDRSMAMSYVYMGFGEMLLLSGDVGGSLRWLEEALDIAMEHGDLLEITRISNKLGQAYHRLGDIEKAMGCYEEVIRLGEAMDSLSFVSAAKNQIGVLLMEEGRTEEAIGFLEEAAKGFEKMGERRALAGALLNMGYIHSELGDFERALEFDTKSLEMVKAMKDPYMMAQCVGNIGWDYLELGDPETAYKKARESMEIRERIGFMLDIHDVHHLLARASLMLGKLDEGEEEARKALSLCRDLPKERGRILVTLGRIAAENGRKEEALSLLSEAMAILEGFGDRRWIEEAKIAIAHLL
jgi:class 3 adenylate cyclase/tetratricopeptide (TPR) repeat protein